MKYYLLLALAVLLLLPEASAQDTALFFDGEEDYVLAGSDPGHLIRGDLTLEVWLKVESYPVADSTNAGQDVLVARYGGQLDSAPSNVTYLLVLDEDGKVGAFHESGDGSNVAGIFSAAGVPLRTWTHVAVVREAGTKTYRIYLDGMLVSETGYDEDTTGGEEGVLVLGSGVTPIDGDVRLDGFTYHGAMDEIRIWDRVLTGTEIAERYGRVLQPQSETGLVVYYPAFEGTGSVLADVAGGYDGEIRGASWQAEGAPVEGIHAPIGTCAHGQATALLDANAVSAVLANNGSLFFGSSGASYVVPKDAGVSPLFAAGLWLGGQVGGHLRTAVSRFGNNEFWPGPLSEGAEPPANCGAYDRIWTVTAAEVLAYEREGTLTDALRDWPAHLGAPVLDGDGNPDNYDLAAGDRPELLGHSTSWWVMNDAGNVHAHTETLPIGMEVQVAAFAVDPPGTDDAREATTFYRYTLLYRGAEPLEEAYLGLWADPDLGHYGDDYVGSDPELDLAFVYNGDDDDENGYGSRPPALGYTILEAPQGAAARFVYYNNSAQAPTGDPQTAQEHYNVLQGRWRDGTPLTYGGNGYGGTTPVDFMFPDDPPAYWSEENIDGAGTANTPGDRRFVLSYGPLTMAPGDRKQVTHAIVWSQANDRLSSVAKLKEDVRAVRQAYAEGRLLTPIAGQLRLGAEVLAFDDTGVGTQMQGSFTLTNDGQAPVRLLSAEMSGDHAADFALGESLTGVVLEGGASRTVTVRFAPSAEGVRRSTLVVEAEDGRLVVALEGQGVPVALAQATPPEAPTEGSPVTLGLQISGLRAPQARLYYRAAGATAYTSTEMTASGEAFLGEVAAAAVGLQGLSYHFEVSEGTLTRRLPETGDFHLQVRLAEVAVPGVLAPRTYQMISVPLRLDAPAAQQVLVDDLGAYEATDWRLFRWDPAQNDYREHGEQAAGFAPGTAYWLIAADSARLDVGAGASTPSDAPFTLTLAPGWNQVGNPFAFPVAWASVAHPEGIEPPVGYRYASTEYDYDVAVLAPWEGYFVYNDTGAEATLAILPVAAAAAKQAASAGLLAETTYGVRLIAALPDRGLVDRQNVAALREGARAGRDAFDLSEAPTPGDHIRLSLLEGDGHRLAASYRAPGAEGQVWDLELQAMAGEALLPQRHRTTIALEETGTRPSGADVYLLDLDAGRRLPVVGQEAEVVLEGRETRRLRLIVGSEAFAQAAAEDVPLVPHTFALRQNYPNPFNPETVIAYELAERGAVTLTIYDVLGREVRTLMAAEQPAGVHTLTWDGRDGGGRPVASGTYLYRLQAGPHTAARTMTLLR